MTATDSKVIVDRKELENILMKIRDLQSSLKGEMEAETKVEG